MANTEIEIIPGKLYYAAYNSPPKHTNTATTHYFSTDRSLIYWNFFKVSCDFSF